MMAWWRPLCSGTHTYLRKCLLFSKMQIRRLSFKKNLDMLTQHFLSCSNSSTVSVSFSIESIHKRINKAHTLRYFVTLTLKSPTKYWLVILQLCWNITDNSSKTCEFFIWILVQADMKKQTTIHTHIHTLWAIQSYHLLITSLFSRNWSTERKPKQTQGEHANSTQRGFPMPQCRCLWPNTY